MAEKKKLTSINFVYEGIFSMKDFFRLLDFWLRDKFFDKQEQKLEEFVNPDGSKQIEIEFQPWKKFSDYHKCVLKIEMMVHNFRNIEVDVNGKKLKLNQGKIEIKFTGYLWVDWQGHWTIQKKKPMLYFVRDLWDRYIYNDITKKYTYMVLDDVTDLRNTLSTYLNMQKYKQMV